mgnify:CR=1 FL=1
MRQTRRKGKDNVNKYRKKVSRGVRNQGKRGTRKYNGLPRRVRGYPWGIL